jgi:hypothetical protein
MMENDDLGRYKGSCTGKWAGQSGRGPSDATKVVFAWDNLESAAKKTITFHIRIFRITGSGAGAAAGASSDSFAIDDEVTENHIYSSSNSCACNHPIISTRAPQSAINACTAIKLTPTYARATTHCSERTTPSRTVAASTIVAVKELLICPHQ